MNGDVSFLFTLQTEDGDVFELLSLDNTLKSEDVKYIKRILIIFILDKRDKYLSLLVWNKLLYKIERGY